MWGSGINACVSVCVCVCVCVQSCMQFRRKGVEEDREGVQGPSREGSRQPGGTWARRSGDLREVTSSLV